MTVMPLRSLFLPGALCLAVPAHAELPAGAQAMIDTAIASGDEHKVATALDLARAAFPESAGEIDAISLAWTRALAERKSAAAAANEHKVRSAGVLSLWQGKAELGGFQSSGNSSNTGVSTSLAIKRQGIDWSHALRARADLQRQNGTTSRQQIMLAYEPRWQFGREVFAFGLTQFEHDRLQRLAGRYSVSGGIGYRLIESDDVKLSVKAGPAVRVSDYRGESSESSLGALMGLDFEWQLLDRVKLTQLTNAVAETGGQATVVLSGSRTSLDFTTGLEFKVSDRLVSRFAYEVEYDSNPPAGTVSTDTLARATLVYGF